jgi:Tol biopolymer transport system component
VYPPYADVQPGVTMAGGNLTIMSLSGFTGFGAGKVSWKADGSALAYVLRSNSNIWQISASPSYGATGEQLPCVKNTGPSQIAWGPTAATQDQYLYYSGADLLNEGFSGIYLNAQGDTSGGEKLVPFGDFDAKRVHDIEWLPDGSGFLFSQFYVGLGYFTNIFRYDFATRDISQLTDLPKDVDYVHGLSISPDGQQVVFERVVDELDSDSSVWLMNIDGSNLHKLVDNAARPAWGRTPAPLEPGTYLPVLVR